MNKLSYLKLFFKAVSNETRLGIIELLKKGSKNVNEISQELNFEQSRVSHNLKCLLNCGFVSVKNKDGFRVYSLNQYVLKILNEIDEHIENYKENLETCGVLENGKIKVYA